MSSSTVVYLSQQLVEELGRRIVGGAYGEAEGLPTEHELSGHYKVSRTVVREALNVLRTKGLIESRPRCGIRVMPESSWNIFDAQVLEWLPKGGDYYKDLAELRVTVEPHAAELAATRAEGESLEAIRDGFNRIRDSIARGDAKAYNEADRDFHEAIVASCQNRLLVHMFSLINPLVMVNREATAQFLEVGHSTVELHQRLFEAIEGRRSTEARERMLAIIDQARELALIAQGGPSRQTA